MKFAATIFSMLLFFSPSDGRAQEVELRWGEFGYYSNWKRYPYEIKSAYPFVGRLPDLREFPTILEWALDPRMNRSDRSIILSQMRTLSRCDFENHVIYKDKREDAEAAYRKAVAKWDEWWSRYGSTLPESLLKTGQRYEDAWLLVASSPYLECPSYPISIPKSWSTTVSFQSGDYGGVTEEVIEILTREDRCELKRRYRTGWRGKEPWTREVWKNLTRAEADRFLAALIYVIDNPWFFADDQFAEVIDGDQNPAKIGQILGRPEPWLDYYPSVEWTGILDADGAVIINHDPLNWDSIDLGLGDTTQLDDSVGVVYRLLLDQFPDPSWDPETSRWEKVEPPPAGKGESAPGENQQD